jgi:hypothetical protein
MLSLSPRYLAQALGGEVRADGALVPGPGHSAKDRSLEVTFSKTAPDGFVVRSYAGDDFAACRDYVCARLGLDRPRLGANTKCISLLPRHEPGVYREGEARKRRALVLWNEARDPRNTPVQRFWRSRALDLGPELASEVIRFLADCPWRGDDGEIRQVPAMLCLMRNIVSDEPTAIHRTALTLDGVKVGRKMLGVVRGSAIKLDADAEVIRSLTIGEGVETVESGRVLGLKPAWALGSVGAIGAFPVLPGVESLTMLSERNADGTPNSASVRAINECGDRWHAAGREVVVIDPPAGDLNDVLRSGAGACSR